ncbi:MAG: hypothetical protein AB1650_02765 [Candidatus Omnitrophota bacterium]
MKKQLSLLIVMILFFSGCATRHGDFTVLSNKMLRLSEFELDKEDRVKNVVGEDVAHIIVVVPTKGTITLESAVDDALEKADGDVMTDVVITQWGFYIPYIYGQMGWKVKGDVVKTRRK